MTGDPSEYVFLNPWKANAPEKQERTAKLNINLYAIFGRKGIDPKVDGLLVCEVYLYGVPPKTGEGKDFKSILVKRFRINRLRSERGGFEHVYSLQPFVNPDVISDYMRSFVGKGDDRVRALELHFYAPDEETYKWEKIYLAVFQVDYRFISLALENRYHSAAYLKLDVEETAEEAAQSRAARMSQVKGTLKANANVAIFAVSPYNEIRAFKENLYVSKELEQERAQWLYGDASKIYTGLKRERDPEQDADLQDAILQLLEGKKGGPSK